MQTLLVDDDFISVFLTEKLFQREGLGQGFNSFQSPVQALAYLQETLAQGKVPDVLLLDLNMPGLTGWDFLTALQPYAPQLAERCFIYILTSSLAPTDRARSQDLPLVAGFIPKPLDSAQIQVIHDQVATSWGRT